MASKQWNLRVWQAAEMGAPGAGQLLREVKIGVTVCTTKDVLPLAPDASDWSPPPKVQQQGDSPTCFEWLRWQIHGIQQPKY